MENLVSSLLSSHPDLFSLALLGRMRCLVRFQPLQSCWSCSDYQSKEKCHAKEMTGDYWTDLISSEPETWTLHQWHQHCKITDQRRSRASLGTGGDGEGQDPSPAPQGISSALLSKWPEEEKEQPQPGVVSYSLELSSILWHLSSSVTAVLPILIPAAQWWLHYQQTDITHCKSERKQF